MICRDVLAACCLGMGIFMISIALTPDASASGCSQATCTGACATRLPPAGAGGLMCDAAGTNTCAGAGCGCFQGSKTVGSKVTYFCACKK